MLEKLASNHTETPLNTIGDSLGLPTSPVRGRRFDVCGDGTSDIPVETTKDIDPLDFHVNVDR